MNKLVIVDVSALMRTYYRPLYSDFPMSVDLDEGVVNTSHLYGLFRQIKDYGVDSDFIFAYDTKYNLLKDDRPDYKAGRSKADDDYFVGYELGKGILEQAGFLVLSKDGYEADHLVIQAKEELSKYYKEVYVITNDKDLTVVVDDKTTWVSTRKKQGVITMDNYEEALGCPYNSIHLKKSLVGDTSDNIKGVVGFGPVAFKKFIKAEDIDFSNVYGNEAQVIEGATTLTDVQKQQALTDLKLIQPLKVPNISLTIKEIDWDYFIRALELFKMKTIIKDVNKQLKDSVYY